jgi:hypothetical protein
LDGVAVPAPAQAHDPAALLKLPQRPEQRRSRKAESAESVYVGDALALQHPGDGLGGLHET